MLETEGFHSMFFDELALNIYVVRDYLDVCHSSVEPYKDVIGPR